MSLPQQPIPEGGWPGLRRHWRHDLSAAFSVSLVALPLSLGIAIASGVEPMAGIITAVVGGLVVTLFRGAYIAINGPGAGLIAVIIGAVVSLDDGNGRGVQYMLAAVVIAGFLQLLLGIFRLGKLASIFPPTVIRGMLASIGIIIFSKQLHVALGTHSDGITSIGVFRDLFLEIPTLNPFIALISMASLLILVIHQSIKNRLLQSFPAPIWVLCIAIALAYLLNFSELHTLDLWGQSYEIGPHLLVKVPDNPLASLLFPDFSKIHTSTFWLAVFSITLIASIETLAIARAIDKLDPYQRITNTDKDLIGNGLGTMISGFLGGLPIIPLIARSSVNIQNHAKTSWSNFFCGIFILLFVVVLSPLIQKVPLAALAAILVYTGYQLAAPKIFRMIYTQGKEQLLFFLTTIVVTLFTDLIWGIFSGILVTLLGHIWLTKLPIGTFFQMVFKTGNRLVQESSNSHRLEINGVANFLSILNINALLEKIPPDSNAVIDFTKASFVDLTVWEKIEDFKRRRINSNLKVTIIQPKGIHRPFFN